MNDSEIYDGILKICKKFSDGHKMISSKDGNFVEAEDLVSDSYLYLLEKHGKVTVELFQEEHKNIFKSVASNYRGSASEEVEEKRWLQKTHTGYKDAETHELHKARMREYGKKWRERNPEKFKEANRQNNVRASRYLSDGYIRGLLKQEGYTNEQIEADPSLMPDRRNDVIERRKKIAERKERLKANQPEKPNFESLLKEKYFFNKFIERC